MALELEETIMREIELGAHYSWFNGSGSCPYIAREAVRKLPVVAEANGLTIAPVWLAHLQKALRADSVSNSSLTNAWIQCSYAIVDAIYRKEGGDGFQPAEEWYFWSADECEQWRGMNDEHRNN